MKFLFSFFLIISLAAVALTNSATWGRREYGDYIVVRQKVYRNPIRGSAQSVNVVFPSNGFFNGTITEIRAYDRFTNTSGATPSILRGGVRYNHVTVNFRSKPSYGINSDLEVYAKRR